LVIFIEIAIVFILNMTNEIENIIDELEMYREHYADQEFDRPSGKMSKLEFDQIYDLLDNSDILMQQIVQFQ
jgi:hypothetical protein